MEESSNLVYNLTLEKTGEQSCELKNHSSQNSNENIEFKGIYLPDTRSLNYYKFRLLANARADVDILNVFLKNIKEDPVMNVRFHNNRSTFLAQHLALEYIKKHNLVNCLINHEFYNQNIAEKPVDINNHIF